MREAGLGLPLLPGHVAPRVAGISRISSIVLISLISRPRPPQGPAEQVDGEGEGGGRDHQEEDVVQGVAQLTQDGVNLLAPCELYQPGGRVSLNITRLLGGKLVHN